MEKLTPSSLTVHPGKGTRPGYTYSEKDWDPITEEEAIQNPSNGYRASKTFAEKASWDFVESEKPKFTIATRIRDIMLGRAREEIAPTGTFLWTDVRDLALAHVRAAERPEAAGKRFFITAGHFSNKEIAKIIRDSFPDLASKLPTEDTKGGDYPEEGQSQMRVALFYCRGILAHILQGYTALTIRKRKKC
ncbi:MAG: hypothetical protein Q9195_004561 [Heterodermia aff. obscurata]